jgi:serine/threonine protein kinase
VGESSAAYPSRHLLFRHRGKFPSPLPPTPSLSRQDTDEFPASVKAIYVWLDRMVFFSDEANEAEDPSDMILRLHVSRFVDDLDDLDGFVEYTGGEQDAFVQRFIGLLSTFSGEGKKRAPFSRWHPVDPQFKDLVSKMTCLNPLRRITAREALQHPWFSE